MHSPFWSSVYPSTQNRILFSRAGTFSCSTFCPLHYFRKTFPVPAVQVEAETWFLATAGGGAHRTIRWDCPVRVWGSCSDHLEVPPLLLRATGKMGEATACGRCSIIPLRVKERRRLTGKEQSIEVQLCLQDEGEPAWAEQGERDVGWREQHVQKALRWE